MLAKLMGHYEEDLCFSEEILLEIDSALNFDLPPRFDDYEVPLVYRDEECSEFAFDSSINLNQPPVLDEYTADDACAAETKKPCFYYSDQKVTPVAATNLQTENSNGFLVQQCCYLAELQVQKAAARDYNSSHSVGVIGDVGRDNVSMFVHGGRWGGRHKDTLKFSEGSGIQPCQEDDSSSLFRYVTSLSLLFILCIFDPGGFKRLELRSIPFKGGGDDTEMTKPSEFTSVIDFSYY